MAINITAGEQEQFINKGYPSATLCMDERNVQHQIHELFGNVIDLRNYNQIAGGGDGLSTDVGLISETINPGSMSKDNKSTMHLAPRLQRLAVDSKLWMFIHPSCASMATEEKSQHFEELHDNIPVLAPMIEEQAPEFRRNNFLRDTRNAAGRLALMKDKKPSTADEALEFMRDHKTTPSEHPIPAIHLKNVPHTAKTMILDRRPLRYFDVKAANSSNKEAFYSSIGNNYFTLKQIGVDIPLRVFEAVTMLRHINLAVNHLGGISVRIVNADRPAQYA